MTNKNIHLQVYRFSKLSIRLLVFPFLTSLKSIQMMHYFPNQIIFPITGTQLAFSAYFIQKAGQSIENFTKNCLHMG
jgi:hypothetical protein